VGQDALALEVAARLAGGYPDGTWLVELAAGTGEADVADRVGRAVRRLTAVASPALL